MCLFRQCITAKYSGPDLVYPGASEEVEEELRHVPDLPAERGTVHHVHHATGSI